MNTPTEAPSAPAAAAPERIWKDADDSVWWDPFPGATPYVRADLHDALAARYEELEQTTADLLRRHEEGRPTGERSED